MIRLDGREEGEREREMEMPHLRRHVLLLLLLYTIEVTAGQHSVAYWH